MGFALTGLTSSPSVLRCPQQQCMLLKLSLPQNSLLQQHLAACSLNISSGGIINHAASDPSVGSCQTIAPVIGSCLRATHTNVRWTSSQCSVRRCLRPGELHRVFTGGSVREKLGQKREMLPRSRIRQVVSSSVLYTPTPASPP